MLSQSDKNKIKIIYCKRINESIPPLEYNGEFYNGVIVSIIHNYQDLNFNCSCREILYALQECLGEHWEFRENNWGKSLQCNFEYVNQNPLFKDIFPIYKKFYMERMKLIFDQYDKRFLDHKTEDNGNNQKYYNIYSEYQSEYFKIKNDIFNLKNQINQKILKLLINNIPHLNENISKIIFDFSKESFEPYYAVRNELEILRNTIKNRLMGFE